MMQHAILAAVKSAPVSYRMSPESRETIRRLAEELRISQAAVVELGVALLERLTHEEIVRLAARRPKNSTPPDLSGG